MKETKKSHQIQFYPSVKELGTNKAKSLGISFQQYLEDLIKQDNGERK